MHARTSLKAHRPVSGVARSTAAAHCIVLLHAIHSSRVVAAAHTRSAALLRPWEDSSLGWWPRPRSGTERLGAPVGLLRARQAPSANLMLTGRDQSSSCQTKSSQDQQKTSFHFQVNSKLRHDMASLCHVNRCLTYGSVSAGREK